MKSVVPFWVSTAHSVAAFTAVAATILSIACGSSSTSITRPGSDRCAIAVSNNAGTIAAGGGNGALTISTARECVWSATSEASWITITAGASGQGDGAVSFTAGSNPSPAIRRGAVVVGDQRAEIAQAAAPCRFALSPAAHDAPAAGGESTVAVDTLQGCTWRATSDAEWIVVTGPQAADGPGSLGFRVAANTGDARTGRLTIGDTVFPITQQARNVECNFAVAPSAASAPAGGGNVTAVVTSPGGCLWSAAASTSWITIASGASGTGTGPVVLTVAPNPGAARTGTATIAGQTVTISQAGTTSQCTYTIAPTAHTSAAAGGAVSVAVTTQTGCGWSAISQAPWIVVSSGSNGNGSGATQLSIAANTGGARAGTVTIAGHAFTVNQSAPVACSYTIDPVERAMPAGGGTASIAVAAQDGCAWTAVSQAPFITVTAGASGSGNGTVTIVAGANAGGARTGTVTVAGRTHTVTQAAAGVCSYTIDPIERAVPAGGATTTIAVASQDGCGWTAVSQAPWITVSAGASGSGNGTVTIVAAANTGPARTGTVTVAGHSHTVTQAAAAVCSYTIDPIDRTVAAAGATATIAVASQDGCGWTAVSQVPWITVTAGASGAGTGAVTIAVAPNTDAGRTGTVLVAGQTHTVTQTAATPGCSVALTPETQAVGLLGGEFDLQIQTVAGCDWRANATVPWIQILTDDKGSGPTILRYRVLPNLTLISRTGTIRVDGRELVVTQGGV